jgi:hypothetical protein
MSAVDAAATPTGPADLRLGQAEQQLYAGILASAGTLVGRYAAAHEDVEVFRMAYALLDGLPRHVVIGAAAEAMRTLYGRAASPDRRGAP